MEKGLSTVKRRNAETRLGQIVMATPHFRGGSPLVRPTPMSSVRSGIPPEVPLNDDEAERRHRRRDNHLKTVMSPGCHTPRSAAHYPERTADSGTSSYSNVEIADHYAVCIKLSAENKISPKNAFGLHLIDWMVEVLRKRGELTNFQVAGCTLDASAKIYAGRVDSIYNDAFKILGGFGRSEAAATDDGDEEGGDNGAEPQRPGGGRKKTKRSAVCLTIEKNPKNLNVSTYDLEFEVDPLFKKISTAIDKEGVDGMLLNLLGVDSDGCGLMLDASCVPIVEDKGEREERSGADMLSGVKALLPSLSGLKICQTFSDFRFNKEGDTQGDSEWANLITPRNNDEYPRPNSNYSMLHPPSGSQTVSIDTDLPSSNNTSLDADNYSEEPDDLPDPSSPSDTVLGTCGDNKVIKGVARSDDAALDSNGDLCLMSNIEISEYSYFKPQIAAAWAGSQHWKLKPRNRDPDNNENTGVKTTQRKSTKQAKHAFRLDFSQPLNKELFKRGKISTVLSQAAINKLDSAHTTLPLDPHKDLSLLYQLFTRPQWKIKRRKVTNNATVDEPLGGDVYNYDNPTDNNASYVDDGDNDVGGAEQDDVIMGNNEFMSLLEEVEGNQRLIPEPQRVCPINIDYAKHAKRMDVKRLKGAMWTLLTSATPTTEDHTPCPAPMPFSTLYSNVVESIPASMAREMSVPISFVCLLHLANEKILQITDNSDLSNLNITLTADSLKV